MLAHTINLLHNLSFLIAVAVVSGYIRQTRLGPRRAAVAQGLLFGAAAVIAMLWPLNLGDGLILDGRSVALSLCGLFYGPLAALCAALPAMAFRTSLGGAGLTMGLLVIFESACFGALLGRRRRPGSGLGELLALGVLVHAVMIPLVLTLPRGMALPTLRHVGPLILLLYPAATLLAGQVLLTQERQTLAGAALRERERQHRALLDAIPDLLFIHRVDGTFLDARPREPERYAIPPDQFLGRKVTEVLPQPLAGQLLAAYGRTLATHRPQHLEYDLPVRGQARQFDARILPYGEDTVICMVRDVTEARQAEAGRRRLEAQLAQAQKLESLGSLASGVAHDINNVLGAILGISSTQELLQPPGAGRQAFAIITKAAERGAGMVKRLLGFARVRPAEERDVDLNAVLLEVAGLLEHTTLAKVTLDQAFSPGLAPVRGDPAALAHAFMNLCVNAVDAMPEGGRLILRTRMAGPGEVEAEVEDTGTGMAPEVLERALDPFFTTKEQGKGTGLGLAMVYSTVKAHHGRLELISRPGAGTRAVLRFPASAGAAPALAAGPVPAPARAPGLDVLVVDDDELVRTSVAMMLEALGHRAACADTGEAALARLAAGTVPDLVVMDMNMPGLGGAGTLPRLRERWPDLPVILATGRADQTALDLVNAHPGLRLLGKPFTLEGLRAAIAAIGTQEVQDQHPQGGIDHQAAGERNGAGR